MVLLTVIKESVFAEAGHYVGTSILTCVHVYSTLLQTAQKLGTCK